MGFAPAGNVLAGIDLACNLFLTPRLAASALPVASLKRLASFGYAPKT